MKWVPKTGCDEPQILASRIATVDVATFTAAAEKFAVCSDDLVVGAQILGFGKRSAG